MRKKAIWLSVLLTLLPLSACDLPFGYSLVPTSTTSEDPSGSLDATYVENEITAPEGINVSIPPVEEEPVIVDIPDDPPGVGYVRSELTGMWIPTATANQKPLAVMYGNSIISIPQRQLSKASIIYECPVENNSTSMLALFEDWSSLEGIGDVTGIRACFIGWALEWDPLFVYTEAKFNKGTPVKNEPAKKDVTSNDVSGNSVSGNDVSGNSVSGNNNTSSSATSTSSSTNTSSQVNSSIWSNDDIATLTLWLAGTDCITPKKCPKAFYLPTDVSGSDPTGVINAYSIRNYLNDIKYENTHSANFQAGHFSFAKLNAQTLWDIPGNMDANLIDLSPQYVNGAYFQYNPEDGLYYRYEYGEPMIDGAYNTQLSFNNIILQYVNMEKDKNDPVMYVYSIDDDLDGYYITRGKAIHIWWRKDSLTGITHYYNDEGDELIINQGHTIVCVLKNKGEKITIQ